MDKKAIAKKGKLISRPKLFFYVFSLVLFGFAIYYFSEIRRDFRLLGHVKIYWLLVAVTAQLVTYYFTALVYRLLLRPYQKSQLTPLGELYKVSVISFFFNQTIPSAGISGNSFLFNYLQKKGLPASAIFSIILTELLTFYTVMECMIVLCFSGTFIYKLPSVFRSVLIGGFVVYLLFGAIVLLARRKRSFDFLYKKLKKLKFIKRFFERQKEKYGQEAFNPGSRDLLTSVKPWKQLLLKALFFQCVIVAADMLTILALFYGLGIQVVFFYVLLGLVGARIISLLPFSPGALILYEGSMTFFFANMGIPVSAAVVVTLLYRLLSFWLPIPAGLFLYRRWLRRSEQSAS